MVLPEAITSPSGIITTATPLLCVVIDSAVDRQTSDVFQFVCRDGRSLQDLVRRTSLYDTRDLAVQYDRSFVPYV